MDVQFTYPEKRGSDEHFGKAGDTKGSNQVQGSPMSGFPCAFDGNLRVYRKDKPDQEAVFVLRFVEGNCIRLQRKVDRMNQKSSITLLFAARILQFSDDEFENNEWR